MAIVKVFQYLNFNKPNSSTSLVVLRYICKIYTVYYKIHNDVYFLVELSNPKLFKISLCLNNGLSVQCEPSLKEL